MSPATVIVLTWTPGSTRCESVTPTAKQAMAIVVIRQLGHALRPLGGVRMALN